MQGINEVTSTLTWFFAITSVWTLKSIITSEIYSNFLLNLLDRPTQNLKTMNEERTTLLIILYLIPDPLGDYSSTPLG